MAKVNINQVVMDIEAHTDGAHRALDALNQHIIETASGGHNKVTNAALAGMVELSKEVISETDKVSISVATALKEMLTNYDKYATQREAAATKQAILEQRLAQEIAKTSVAENKEIEESNRQVSRSHIQMMREEAAEARVLAAEMARVARENAASAAQAIRLGPENRSITDRRLPREQWVEGKPILQDIQQQFSAQNQLNEALAVGNRLRAAAGQVDMTREINAAATATQKLIFEDQKLITAELQLREARNAAYVVMQNNGLPKVIQEEQEYIHQLAQEVVQQREVQAARNSASWNTPGSSGPPMPPNMPPIPPGGGGGFGGALGGFGGFGGGLGAVGGLAGSIIGGPPGGMIGSAIGSSISGVIQSVQTGVSTLMGLVGNLAGMIGTGLKLGVEALTAPLRGLLDLVGNGVKSFGDFFGGLVSGALTLGLAYIGVQTFERALKTLLETTVGFNADLELSHNAWGLLLKDMRDGTNRADDMQMAMQQNAIATSFGFANVDKAVRQLLQGGLNVGEIFGGMLTAVQDVAASMGPNMLHAADRLALALGQIKEAGHLTGEEMRQLRNAGVNIPEVFDTISRQTGITTAKLQEMQRAGTLTSEMFFRGFKEWANVNFGGLAEVQAKSFTGAMEQMREAITVTASRAVKPGFELMSSTVQEWAKIVTGPEVMMWAARFSGTFQGILEGVQRLAVGFRVGLDQIISIVQSAGQLVYTALQWLNPFAHHSASLVESVEDGVQRILDAYNQLGREIPDSLSPAADAMINFRKLTEVGLGRIDADQFAHLAKDLASIGPGAPQAYREVQLAIRGIREDAAALSPEIISETENVRQLKNELANQNTVLAGWELKLKLARDELEPLNEQIKAHQIAIQLLNVDLLRANREYADFLNTLQGQRAAVAAAEERIHSATIALEGQQIALRQGEMGLVSYKEAVTNAQDRLTGLQENLNRTKDALSDVNAQLAEAKQGLKDVLATPLEGTAKFATQISDAETKIAQIQLRIANARAAGAKDDSLKSMNAQLAVARAHLDAIQARKKVEIDIPEQQLKLLAAGHTEEISIGMKREGIEAAQAAITPLEAAAKALSDQARHQRDLVRNGQEALADAKENLHVHDQLLNLVRARVKEMEGVKQQAELDRDVAKQALDIALQTGKPIQDKIILLTQERDRRQEALNIVEAEKKTIELIDIQPIIDKVEEEKRVRDEINTRLTTAKGHLSDLQGAQAALVNLAKSWQGEIDEASRRAKAFVAQQEEDAKKAGKLGSDTTDTPRETGADEATSKFKAMRLAMEAEQKAAKADFDEWVTGLQTQMAESVPWLGGFFGRVTGFLSGAAEAMSAAATGDLPTAGRLFFETLQDVADGLPEQLVTWTHAFLDWVDTTGVALVLKGGEMVDGLFKFVTGEGASDLEGGVATWAQLFIEWIPPMWDQLITDITLVGKNLDDWITNQLPVYEASLAGWKEKFIAWVHPIWDPLSKTLMKEVLEPAGEWIKVNSSKLGAWVLNNWVTPFVAWVFDGEAGAWKLLRPEVIRFIDMIGDLISGKQDETDPLIIAGKRLAGTIKDGALRVMADIAVEIMTGMFKAITNFLVNHGVELVMALQNPFQALGSILGQMTGKALAEAIPNAIQKGLNWEDIKHVLSGGILPDQAKMSGNRAPETSLNNQLPGNMEVPFTELERIRNTYRSTQLTNEQQAVMDGMLYGKRYQEGVNEELEIESPSKVFHRIGAKAAEGMNLGFAGGIGAFKETAAKYAFEADGTYFSMAAGQKVRSGFSLNGARKIEDEPWYLKHQELFPDPPERKPLSAAAVAAWNSDTMPAKIPGESSRRFLYPEKDKPPMPYEAAPDTAPHSFSYDSPGAGEPDRVTLIINQNGILVGSNGMKEFADLNTRFLARDLRLKRLY